MGESQQSAAPPAPSRVGRSTVCSTTMGMSGRARVAVACRLRCKARPVLGVRCWGKGAARRGPNAGNLPAATRAPLTNILGHIPPCVPPGFRPMAELQLPVCFAPMALAH